MHGTSGKIMCQSIGDVAPSFVLALYYKDVS